MLVIIMYGFSVFIATIFGAAAAAVASSPGNNEASSELEENDEVWHDCIDNDPHTGIGFLLPENNSNVGDYSHDSWEIIDDRFAYSDGDNSDDSWEIMDDRLGYSDGDNSDDSWEIIDDRLGHSVGDAYGDSWEIIDIPGHSNLESNSSLGEDFGDSGKIIDISGHSGLESNLSTGDASRDSGEILYNAGHSILESNSSIGDASSDSEGLVDRPGCSGVESNSSIGDTCGNSQAVLSTPCNCGQPGVLNQDVQNCAGAVEGSGRHESGLRYRGNSKGLAADQDVTALGTGSIEKVKMGRNQNGTGQQNIGPSTYLRQFVAVQNIRIYDSNSRVASLLVFLLLMLFGMLVWSQCFIIALLELLLYRKQKLD